MAVHRVVKDGVESDPYEGNLAAAKSFCLGRLAEKRWEVEQGGCLFNGVRLQTDDRAKVMLAGAHARAVADPSFATSWSLGPGVFVTMDAAALAAAFAAVTTFIGACFDRQAVLAAAIQAAETNDAAYDVDIHSGWPE